jgi:hypothetical protein
MTTVLHAIIKSGDVPLFQDLKGRLDEERKKQLSVKKEKLKDQLAKAQEAIKSKADTRDTETKHLVCEFLKTDQRLYYFSLSPETYWPEASATKFLDYFSKSTSSEGTSLNLSFFEKLFNRGLATNTQRFHLLSLQLNPHNEQFVLDLSWGTLERLLSKKEETITTSPS